MSPAKAKTSKKLQQLKQKHSDSGLKTVKKVLSKTKQSSKGRSFRNTRESVTPSQVSQSLRTLYGFFFLQMSLLVLWVAYRAFTSFSVWFDEGVAKAILFGLPVFWFAARSKFVAREIGLDANKLIPGVYLGLAIGGLYGFAAILAQVLGGTEVVGAPFYLTNDFWWLAFLALLTAWWESLFFFGLPIQFIRSVASWISESVIVVFVVAFFLLFHSPLRIILAGPSPQFLVQMGVLTLFVIGQYMVYTRTKNMYAIVLSHLFWGLVIQVYSM